MKNWGGAISQVNSEIQGVKDSGVKIETGSYVGTGTGGVNHKSTLTFNITPQLVFIAGDRWGFAMQNSNNMQIQYGSSGNDCIASWHNGGEKLQWYANDDRGFQQLNASGIEYHYVAIG